MVLSTPTRPLDRHATAPTGPRRGCTSHPAQTLAPATRLKSKTRGSPPPTERRPGLQPPSYSHGSVPAVGTESGRLRLIYRSGPGGGSTHSSKANGTGKAQEEMAPGTSRRPWRAVGPQRPQTWAPLSPRGSSGPKYGAGLARGWYLGPERGCGYCCARSEAIGLNSKRLASHPQQAPPPTEVDTGSRRVPPSRPCRGRKAGA